MAPNWSEPETSAQTSITIEQTIELEIVHKLWHFLASRASETPKFAPCGTPRVGAQLSGVLMLQQAYNQLTL